MIVELGYASAPVYTYNLSRQPVTWFVVSEQDVGGTDSLRLTCTKEEGNQVKRKLTGDLFFYDVFGTMTDILNHLYVMGQAYMWIRIYDCSCNLYIFKGQITRDKVEWCSGDCFMKCRATEYDEITDAYLSLNNVLNYDNYKLAGEQILNFQVRNGNSEVGAAHYQESARAGGLLRNSIQTLPEFFFKSSILDEQLDLNGWTGDLYGIDPIGGGIGHTNPYFHSYILNADISKGVKLTSIQPPGNLIRTEHKYVRTIKDFLTELKQVFNADYLLKKVGSNVYFVFERKDYFFQTASIWKDCREYAVCFEIDDRNQYAYADMTWQTEGGISDAVDFVLCKQMYNNIEEWNRPVSPIQKEVYTVSLPYGFAPPGDDAGETFISMRPPYTFSTPTLVIPGEYTGFSIGYGGTYNLGQYLLPNNLAHLYDLNSAFYFNGDLASIYMEYTGLGIPSNDYIRYRDINLYDCFHFIENPQLTAHNHLGYTGKYSKKYLRFNFKIKFTCAEYLSFTNDSAINITVLGVVTKALIEEISFNFADMTADIRGLV